MLSIETKTKKKLPRVLVLSLLSLALGIVSFGIIFFWFDDNFPSYGSLSYFDRYISKKAESRKIGIYFDKGIIIPESLKILDALEKYSDLETSQFDDSKFAITTTNGILAKTSKFDNSEVVFKIYAVPITKFGSLKRDITISESDNIGLFEEKLIDYFPSYLKPALLSCEEIKNKVNESDEIGLVSLDCVDSSVSILGVAGTSIFGNISIENKLTKEDGYLENYPLTYNVWFNYSNGFINENFEIYEYFKSFFNNESMEEKDANSIVMTGVTAMGRGTMWKIRDNGPLYPIEKVAEVLQDADIAHTSNEVSFVSGCTQESHTMSFCALPESIDTLTYAGIDVVELTGNHNNDKGWKYNLSSMETYEEKDITYIGGGKDLNDAYTVKYTDLGGYKVGWIGFNELGPAYAWAAEGRPGAAEYWEDKLIELSKEASVNSDIAILVFQWANENYSYPTEFQKKTARLAIDNGIDLVVGSQGHGTLKMEFYKGIPIYYGLGNFLFDQMFSDKVRSGMILRINTINGEIRNLEMLPYMIENYAQPNFVYGETAEKIVRDVVDW